MKSASINCFCNYILNTYLLKGFDTLNNLQYVVFINGLDIAFQIQNSFFPSLEIIQNISLW